MHFWVHLRTWVRPYPLANASPDDLIVGSSGSTGEVEAICIPSTSPPIARLKPLGVASRCARHVIDRNL